MITCVCMKLFILYILQINYPLWNCVIILTSILLLFVSSSYILCKIYDCDCLISALPLHKYCNIQYSTFSFLCVKETHLPHLLSGEQFRCNILIATIPHYTLEVYTNLFAHAPGLCSKSIICTVQKEGTN